MNVKVTLRVDDFHLSSEIADDVVMELISLMATEMCPNITTRTKSLEQPVDPTTPWEKDLEPAIPKRAYVRHKTLNFTKERDKIIRDNFEKLGHSGIFDKSLLPGFSLAELRQRCIELGLLDQYGNRAEKRRKHVAETA